MSPAISSDGAPPAPCHDGLASPLAPSRSILSHSSRGSTRGFDPPSVVVGPRASGSAFVSGVGSQVLPPRPFSPCWPDPKGVDAPPTFMGGMGVPCFVGCSSHSHGLYPPRPSSTSGFSTSSTATHYRQINFPDPIPEGLPTVVFSGDRHHPAPPPPGGYPHAPASVASPSAVASSPLSTLSHGDLSSSSALDLTMSSLPSGILPSVVPLNPPPPPPGVTTPAPTPGLTTPAPAPSSSLVPAPPAVPFWSSEPFKLPIIKDAKAYLDVHDMIQYYLCQPEYSTQRSDDVLVTSASNVAASLFWERQLQNAVRKGSLWFLFKNKGTLYHGKGFEMLAALDQHCRPDLITNAFCTLMSLFNDVQGSSEAVFEFCSPFDGMVMDLSCSKTILPPILLIMLFLRTLHSRYSDILDQFWSRYKKLEAATIDSKVEDVHYHDEFKLLGSDKKTPGGSTPRASAANVGDKSGKEWASPFEWLSTYDTKRIKVCWDRAIAGTGICPICHRTEKPWHVPAKCLLLKDLNLKIVHGPPSSAPTPAPYASPAPAPVVPSPSPSPGGRIASTDDHSVAGSVGPPSAP